MKKVLGYTAAFVAGSLLSGSVAWAADNYVQAQQNQSVMTVNGQTISSPDSLVYNGSTYVQLYSFEQGLKNMGMTPTWDGKTFAFSMPVPLTEKNLVNKLNQVLADNKTQLTKFVNLLTQPVSQSTYDEIQQIHDAVYSDYADILLWYVPDLADQMVLNAVVLMLVDELESFNFAHIAYSDQLNNDSPDFSQKLLTSSQILWQAGRRTQWIDDLLTKTGLSQAGAQSWASIVTSAHLKNPW